METAVLPTSASFVTNRFRLLGLPSSASASEIRDAARAWTRHAQIGRERTTAWDIPSLGRLVRSEEAVRRAASELDDPRTRVVDRLVWPARKGHPLEGFLSAFGGVRPNDSDARTALDSWIGALADGPAVRDVEQAESLGGFDRVALTDDLAELRSSWLAVVGSALAELVLPALRSGDSGPAKRLFSILRSTPERRLVAVVARLVTGPLEDEVTAECAAWSEALNAQIVRKDDGVAAANLAVCREREAVLRELVKTRIGSAAAFADVSSAWERVRTTFALAAESLAKALTWADAWCDSERVLMWSTELAAGTSVLPRLKVALQEATLRATRHREDEEELRRKEKEDETSAEDLRQGRVHRVLFSGGRYRFPKLCACCREPTEFTSPLQKTESHGNGTSTWRLETPLCRECQHHVRDADKRRSRGLVGAGLAACATAALLWFAPTVPAPLWALLCGVAALAGGHVGLRIGPIPLTALPERHASRFEPVRLGRSVTDGIQVEFADPAFARLTAEVNGTSAERRGRRNPGRSYGAAMRRLRIPVVTLAVVAASLSLLGPILRDSASRPRAESTRGGGSRAVRTVPRTTPLVPATLDTTGLGTFGRDTRLQQLSNELASLKSEISTLESEIGALDRQMESLTTRIDTASSYVDALRRIYERHPESAAAWRAYQAAVDQHNALARSHNAALEQRSAAYNWYSTKIERHNALVRQYNASLGR